MAKKNRTKREAEWAEAKRKCRLNTETLRMAKELGLNPRSLIKNIPNKAEPWKAPVHVWIREMYDKRQAKAAQKRDRKAKEQKEGQEELPANNVIAIEMDQPNGIVPRNHHVRSVDQEPIPFPGNVIDDDLDNEQFPGLQEDSWFNDEPPGKKDIAEEDQLMLRRRKDFRIAAGRVAEAFSRVPTVHKVMLFGSVAAPLEREVPRFREFRRAGIAIWHECRDVDLAVWVDDLSCLKRLQKARSRAMNDLLRDMDIGVAHHQVEVFIFEPGTDQYLGRLCCFGKCPKGKPECVVAGCGVTPFLQQHDDFTFRPDSLASERVEVLYDRNLGLSRLSDENEIPF